MAENKHNESHWVVCPCCGGKTKIKINENTVLLNFPLFCPRCKKESIIGIIKFKTLKAQSLQISVNEFCRLCFYFNMAFCFFPFTTSKAPFMIGRRSAI